MGGNAFDVDYVDQCLIPSIYKQFKAFLKTNLKLDDLLVIDDSIAGLGSTRRALNNINSEKMQSGDIDLLIKIKESALEEHTNLQSTIKAISARFDQHKIHHQIFFGNILSSAFKNIQIDLVLAPPTKNDNAYEYLRDLVYYSDEDDPTRSIKGLHRTELIRFLLKGIGLHMSTKSLIAYKWANVDKDDAISYLEHAKNKAKKNKKHYEFLLNVINIKGYSALKQDIINVKTGCLKNSLSISSSYDFDLLNLLTKTPILERIDFAENWEKTINNFMCLKGNINISNEFQTFEKTLDFIKELEILEILCSDTIHNVFKNYIKRLNEGNNFNSVIKEKILNKGFQI